MISLMTWRGRGTDSGGTTSMGRPASRVSTRVWARARTAGSRARTTDGLKPGWTRRR